MSAERVIVVGGGVIGAACAYFLSKAGLHVTILDQGGFGKGCSHGNCGFVCPSHVLPLAGPGAVAQSLHALLKKNSPFRIKPRLDFALWSWLVRFARRCNTRDMRTAGRAIQALLNSSRSLYDHLMKAEPFDCEWQTRGMLFVFCTPAAMEHYAPINKMLHEEFGVVSTRYDGAELLQLEPALKAGLAGGWHYTSDAHLRPDRLMASWRHVLAQVGVTVREHCQVNQFVGTASQARALATNAGELPADAFVVATGALTPLLNRDLGCRIPIQPGKGYSMTMRRPAKCPSIPLLFEEHRVAVTPMHSGYRLGSTMEFAGYDTTLDRRRLELLKEGAHHYLQEPYTDAVDEEWYGWRPMTPDSLPIIDRSPAFANVFVAAGHNMLGVSMAPATGKLIAEMLTGQPTHLDPGPYRVSRFSSWF